MYICMRWVSLCEREVPHACMHVRAHKGVMVVVAKAKDGPPGAYVSFRLVKMIVAVMEDCIQQTLADTAWIEAYVCTPSPTRRTLTHTYIHTYAYLRTYIHIYIAAYVWALQVLRRHLGTHIAAYTTMPVDLPVRAI